VKRCNFPLVTPKSRQQCHRIISLQGYLLEVCPWDINGEMWRKHNTWGALWKICAKHTWTMWTCSSHLHQTRAYSTSWPKPRIMAPAPHITHWRASSAAKKGCASALLSQHLCLSARHWTSNGFVSWGFYQFLCSNHGFVHQCFFLSYFPFPSPWSVQHSFETLAHFQSLLKVILVVSMFSPLLSSISTSFIKHLITCIFCYYLHKSKRFLSSWKICFDAVTSSDYKIHMTNWVTKHHLLPSIEEKHVFYLHVGGLKQNLQALWRGQ